ncbi:MAG: hypothetical protein M3Z13_04270, partial [Candidatus Dormibacteraeota bacterium]|nr:hypothetical protein [Candidatus Dormibacteraeota bacterium]
VEGAPGQSWRRDFLHGLQTLPGMMGVIVAVVAGTLAALMAVFLSAPEWGMVVTGVAVFLVTLASTAVVGGRGIVAYMKRMRPLFPTP